ncbi:MAG: aldo/keto reductase [Clostridia bacterium]|nr:aldo/keto reductase [Clostridia bacterium]
MVYREDKKGNKLSVLGFGCMRFARKLGVTDMKATEEQIMEAYRLGVNYFDTAYIYPGSESALGEILEKNGIRNKVFIATKLPHYLIKKAEDLDRLFSEELRRLRTDRVDYYLMHMLTDVDAWNRLKSLGIEEWLAQKLASGHIGQVGFSYHGNSDMFCRLVDAYPWDMTLIQYNYMDENTQAGRRGLSYAHKKGLAVMIMEPLRGGKLVSRLPEGAKDIFASHKPSHTPAQWSFKWLFSQPEVTVVLSGMNSLETVRDNAQTAATTKIGELTPGDTDMLRRVAAEINRRMKVGCTGCGYCLPCPKGVDIPGVFAAYNRRFAEGRFWSFTDYIICTTLRKNATAASNCIGCGKCEKHCPQGIDIRNQLKKTQKEFEGPVYKIARKGISVFTKF